MMNHQRLIFLSLLSGFMLSVPWMFNSLPWILFVAFIPLLLVDEQLVKHKQNYRSVVLFFYAFLSFLVWNVLSTWWIAYVSLGGMILISVLNSCMMAGIWWLMQEVRRRYSPSTGYFSLIVFWLTFEYLHFHWAIQWPWLTLGNGFSNATESIQWYEFTGVLGGSLWVLMVNIFLFLLYKSFVLKKSASILWLSLVNFSIILLPISYSFYRYLSFVESGKTIEVVVVQPNLDPYTEKFSAVKSNEQSRNLICLAETKISDSTSYVLAPETALETLYEDENLKKNDALQGIDSLIIRYPSLNLIAGAITQKNMATGEPVSYTARMNENGMKYELYNSALLIDHSPKVQIGHKNILVSGVEKIPFQQYFAFMGNYSIPLGGVNGSLSAGTQPSIFNGTQGEKAGVVICFESVFGGYVASVVRGGANFIFVLTNDGWWKESAGLTQHFNFSRLRAIETRRSVVRSANTGISGFINERGDVIDKSKINTAVALKARIHENKALTYYVAHGDYLGWIGLLLSALMAIYFFFDFLKGNLLR